MKLSAPAKVNLSLQILTRRADGFHEIESLITPISLADEVTIHTQLGRRVRLESNDTSLPTDQRNLAVQAAHVFYQHTGLHFETHIHLEKRIPHGAGLGGGSSDAATVLVALNRIFETHLPDSELETLAARIGSDVPFFIASRPAWSRGRGELLEPTSLAKSLPLLLIKPPFAVETPWAYRAWQKSPGLPTDPREPQTLDDLTLTNDLERPVFQKFLLLPVLKSWLLAQPETRAALMSGSGSTLFAVCHTPEAADTLAIRARTTFRPDYWIETCHTLNESPRPKKI